MRTSLHVIRSGPLLGLVALLAGIPSIHAAPATHRYEIRGSLESVATEKTAADAPLRVNGRLSAQQQDASLQSGGDFVVMAKVTESPLGCSGSDTIFTDGFDP